MFFGAVDFYNETRGYGFIQADDGKSHFFHFSQLAAPEWIATVGKGVRVSFDVGPTDRDPKKSEAKNIKLV